MLDIRIPTIVVFATSYSPSIVSSRCRPITCVTAHLSLHRGDGYCTLMCRLCFPPAGGCKNGDDGGHCNDAHHLWLFLPHILIFSSLHLFLPSWLLSAALFFVVPLSLVFPCPGSLALAAFAALAVLATLALAALALAALTIALATLTTLTALAALVALAIAIALALALALALATLAIALALATLTALSATLAPSPLSPHGYSWFDGLLRNLGPGFKPLRC
jgi:hypothetical protein